MRAKRKHFLQMFGIVGQGRCNRAPIGNRSRIEPVLKIGNSSSHSCILFGFRIKEVDLSNMGIAENQKFHLRP